MIESGDSETKNNSLEKLLKSVEIARHANIFEHPSNSDDSEIKLLLAWKINASSMMNPILLESSLTSP